MDKLYSNTYLKNLLNQILIDNIDIKTLTKNLQYFATLDNYDDNECNIYLLAIYAAIKDTSLSALNKILLEEIKNHIIFNLLSKRTFETNIVKSNLNSFSPQEELGLSIYQGIPSDKLPDLKDPEAVKKYFLMKHKFLPNPEGAFKYPKEGETDIIRSGDNMTIPGIRYMINYVIDHEGNILDIKGYPEQILEKTTYEDIYKGLIGKLFENTEEECEEKND